MSAIPSHLSAQEKQTWELGLAYQLTSFIFQSQEDPRFIGGMNCGQHILL